MQRNLTRGPWALLALGLALTTAGAVASCGGSDDDDDSGTTDPSGLNLTPDDQQITIDPAGDIPSIDYDVTRRGAPVDASWSVDRPDLADIDADGTLTPTGGGAGVVTITAEVDGVEASTTLTVAISTTQNGPGERTPGAEPETGTPGDYEAGPGGFMGVGGEGIGGAVTDELAEVLQGDPRSDSDMAFLYPYDGTVWPLGMLAPLLMWDGSEAESAEAIKISLETDGFAYEGLFGRPAALDDGDPFVRHPIPNDVWQAATRSAAGGTLTVNLVVARGGQAYGPITETWRVADGQLVGCVYYQAYFTDLVDNEHGAIGSDDRFGGATLGIRPGGTDPVLVAGYDSDDKSGCRVCHSVSANGSRMVVQHGDDYNASSDIDLQAGYDDTSYPGSTDGALGWIGMTPDGQLGVGNAMQIQGDANAGVNETELYDMDTGEPIASTGLSDFVTSAGLPAFSPDGTMIAFNFHEGPGNDEIGSGDGHKLVVMDFERDSTTFSNPRLMYEDELRPLWPSFFPDARGLAFEVEIEEHLDAAPDYVTLTGGQAELWWAHLGTGESAPLERANGTENGTVYLPTSDEHPNDAIINFEPTVSPVHSGGYAWIVFVSRRLYGNVITAPPYESDPRRADLTQAYSPKKLWIAAIDLDAEPGTDPSYPAIYLPAQEIQASNSRGFWTSDPCIYTGQM